MHSVSTENPQIPANPASSTLGLVSFVGAMMDIFVMTTEQTLTYHGCDTGTQIPARTVNHPHP